MCQEGTSESLEGILPGGLISRGKNLKDSIHCTNWVIEVFWSQKSSR